MTAYRRGVYAEKRTADHLRKDGYFVAESRGSHGLADLVAVKPRQVLLVQVKGGDADSDAAHRGEWWNDLYYAARRAGAVAIIADWPVRGLLRLREITGPHQPRSRTWPTLPFTTDLVAKELPDA